MILDLGSPIKVAEQGYPFGINAIAYDPDNKDMYVSIDDYRAFENPSSTYDGTVSVIDSFHNTVVGSPIKVGQFPVGIGYSPYSKEMYVVNNKDGTVSVINPSSNTVVGSPIRVGNSPDYVAGAYPDNYEMYVTNRGDGTVSMIDASSNTVVGSPIRVGNNPGGNPLGIAYCSGP